MLAARTVPRLFFCLFLEVFELDFRAYPSLLLGDGLFEFVGELLLQSRQLLLVVFFGLLEQFRERTLLGFLFADRLAQLAGFAFHLVFVWAFLDVRVVALLVLSRFVVHLLKSVALGVRVWSGSGRPVDVVDFCKGSLCIFDCSDDFAVLVSGAAEADGHALAIEPRQDTGEDSVNGTEGGESDAGGLLVGGETCQRCCDEDLQEVEEGDDVV